jgi:hypothetical protein
MATTRFCAFNKTRGIILSLDVSELDAALDPLKVLRVLMEGLSSETSTGLWLTHFRAVPVARAVSPFDLVYLDKDGCVVHAVALSVDSVFEPFQGEPASALVLPASVIASSHTEPGDQLVIVAAPESSGVTPPAQSEHAVRQAPVPIRVQPVPAPQPVLADEEDAILSRYLSGQAHQSSSAHPAAPAAAAAAPAILEPPPPAPAVAPPLPNHLQAVASAPLAEPEAAPAPSAPAARPTIVPKPAVEYYREPKPTLRERVQRWMYPELQPPAPPPNRKLDRRRAYRLYDPDLVAYYFTGGAPHPHRIENISVTGCYMDTDDLWMPGTIIRMTLQKLGSRGDRRGDTITVHSRLVRRGVKGGAFEFMLSGFLD